MSTRRQEKFARLIQRELGDLFLKEGKKIFGDAMISVTKVLVSPDLGYAKIYLNFINVKNTDEVIELVQNHAGEIRFNLGKRIRNQARKIPELSFFYDDTLDYVEKMDKLFKDINKN
ncbi:MAG: 30S ribosome-binding factor RbfA [Bacteroidota bacterium]|nr:30S ribosome-binding factor RbfA [Bacteroidota bacterium]